MWSTCDANYLTLDLGRGFESHQWCSSERNSLPSSGREGEEREIEKKRERERERERGGVRSTVIARWTAGQQDERSILHQGHDS